MVGAQHATELTPPCCFNSPSQNRPPPPPSNAGAQPTPRSRARPDEVSGCPRDSLLPAAPSPTPLLLLLLCLAAVLLLPPPRCCSSSSFPSCCSVFCCSSSSQPLLFLNLLLLLSTPYCCISFAKSPRRFYFSLRPILPFFSESKLLPLLFSLLLFANF